MSIACWTTSTAAMGAFSSAITAIGAPCAAPLAAAATSATACRAEWPAQSTAAVAPKAACATWAPLPWPRAASHLSSAP
eukprot:1601715-Lingulodinium_polyedra.AAC.1